MAAGPQVVNLATVDPKQLVEVQERVQAEIERFAQSLQFFGRSSSIYLSASKAIEGLNETSEGQQMMLPLTQSLYVSGEVASTDQVLVDIGTGYYVEMSTEQGQDYCKRKYDKLQTAMQGLNEVLRTKQSQLMQIKKALTDKMQAMQQQQGPPMPGP